MPRQLYHLQVEGCGFPKWYNMPVKGLSVVCGLYEEKWLLFAHLGYFLTHLPTECLLIKYVLMLYLLYPRICIPYFIYLNIPVLLFVNIM